MKHTLFLLVFILGNKLTIAQSKFFIQAQCSPKITINNNTGLLSRGRYSSGSNEPDGRSALSFGVRDFSFSAGYRINEKNSIGIGIGIFAINQIFRPARGEFSKEYKNIHKYINFITIPISFEHLLYTNKKTKIYGGVHLSFIGDVFPHKNNREFDGNLRRRNGVEDTNYQWHYSVHYLNMKTFNFLYGFSVKGEYYLNKRACIYASAQMMQGFRPLITSFMSITQDQSTYSPSISTTNGQSIMMNLGVRYNL